MDGITDQGDAQTAEGQESLRVWQTRCLYRRRGANRKILTRNGGHLQFCDRVPDWKSIFRLGAAVLSPYRVP